MTDKTETDPRDVADDDQAIAEGNRVLRPSVLQAVLDFFTANPTATMEQAAVHFKVSRAWIHTMVNSDMFRAQLYERRKAISDQVVSLVTEELTGTLSYGIHRIADLLETTTDENFVLDAVELLSKRYNEIMGYSNKAIASAPLQPAPGTQQNNYFFANPDDLKRIRDLSREARMEHQIDDHALPAPKEPATHGS